MMLPRPVKKYRAPAYPTRLEIADRPALLRKHVPFAWRRNALTSSALAALLATGTGMAITEERDPFHDPSDPIHNIARVFDRGDGRGSTGCVVVAPPAFLSEDEAMQIITEELGKAGIDTSRKNVKMKNVRIMRGDSVYGGIFSLQKEGTLGTERDVVRHERKPIKADLFDINKKVAVEFLSRADYDRFQERYEAPGSSVTVYDIKKLADSVRRRITNEKPNVKFGVFYDPLAMPEFPDTRKIIEDCGDDEEKAQKMRREAMNKWHKAFQKERKSKTESKRLLRLQVKDFVDWLKGQGVI